MGNLWRRLKLCWLVLRTPAAGLPELRDDILAADDNDDEYLMRIDTTPTAIGQRYYVNPDEPTASDTNDGSPFYPLATLAEAHKRCRGGDIVFYGFPKANYRKIDDE